MMTWTQQVAHVFFKDVRATRWFLVGYATLLLLGIVEVVAQEQVGAVPLGAFLLRVLAIAICALVVLADSPFSQRAHWATLPYARSAVVAAKGVMIGVLLIATGLALIIALSVLEVPFRDSLLPTGLSLLGFLALLVAAALIASVERSFVAVAVVMAASLPVLLLLAALVATFFNLVLDTSVTPPWVMYAAFVAAAAFVLQLFRSRRVGTPLRLGVLFAAIVLVSVQFNTVDGFAYAEETPASDVLVSAELARRGGGRAPTDESLDIAIQLRGISSSQRADWSASSVRIGNAPELLARPVPALKLPLNSPRLPLPASLRWLGASPLHDAGEAVTGELRLLRASTPIILRTSATNDRVDILTDFGDTTVSPGTSVAVRGTMELREPHVFARLPLTRKSRFSQHGRRITVRDASLQPHPEVRLELESVVKGGRPDLHDYTFVLVNNRRNEAVRMQLASSQYSRDSWLLAPSILGRVTGVLQPTYYGITPYGWQQLGMTVVQFDGAWLQEAELVVIEWKLVGSFPVAAQSRIDSI